MKENPKSIRFVRSEKRLEATWLDGRSIAPTAHQLRCACRCASCVDENTGIRVLDLEAVPKDVTITDMSLVGNYAIKFVFSDGHDTGLYTWDHMAEM